MSTLTKMSNNRETQVVAGAFMVVLTLWWLRHRRGLAVLAPAVLIITAYEIEHQLQHTLKLLAARTGPVPAGLGSFPSGGVARLMSIYGLILYLVLRRLEPHAQQVGGSGVDDPRGGDLHRGLLPAVSRKALDQ